jgi:tricorn protease
MRTGASFLILLALTAVPVAAAESDTGAARLLRFPTIHGNQLVFTWGGDLYTVAASGGVARKLTNHDGYEMFARFSPDGKWLAFTAQYDGNTEVYLMPAEGGVPRRLTYTATLGRDDVSDRMGPNNIVLGWTPDGEHVLFRSRMHSFNDFIGQLYRVPRTGGLAEPLPLPRGGFACYAPDGKKLVYNRVFREFRTWKRYRGGMADEVWLYDLTTKKTRKLTDNPAQDIMPLWHGDRIYFLSDRDANGRMNLYVTDTEGSKPRQLTHFKDFDIKFPSLGDDAIVFENAGWIYRFDLKSEETKRIPIRILEDQAATRGGLIEVGKKVTNYEIAPDGKHALFGARGDVFTVPAKSGITRNLTNTSGVHERNSKWSPDGKLIAYISDATGEDEIFVQAPDGRSPPRQITHGGDTYKWELSWSPDSKKILWTDKKLRLFYVEVDSKKAKLVHRAPVWEIRDAVWSPDSKWIAYSQEERGRQDTVYLYSLEHARNHAVTQGRYGSSGPAFSGDGKYLFFASRRDFHPIYSEVEWNFAYRDMERIYFVTLAADTPSPFRPRGEDEAKADAGKAKAEKKAAMRVDLDGLSARVLRLPIASSTYHNLASVGSTVYYLRRGNKDTKPALQMYDLAAKKETSLGSVRGFEISADGKKMLVAQGDKYGIIDLPKGPVTIGNSLDLSGMQMHLHRHKEWLQIYRECWRQMRDFFYDPTMHGLDWQAVRAKYEPLVAHAGHRADVTYVIGEMIAELNAGHTYVGGGDMPHPARIPTGLLGARLRRDAKTGYYQVVKVLRGNRWDPSLRSPLAELGVNVKDGDYILAVDGRPTSEMKNIYEALVNQAGKQIRLRVNHAAKEEGSREVTVVPIDNEAELYYHEWVEGNRKRVHDATDGKVGYLHVPDMQQRGLNAFARQFYPCRRC